MNPKSVKIHNPVKFRLQKALLVAFLIIAFGAFGYRLYKDNYFSRYSPREPQASTGEVIEYYVNHGTRVYITQHEEIETRIVLPCISIISFLTGLLLNKKWKHFRPHKDA